nr:thiamine pyrophosphate-dependent enzyme [Roseitranquillus sediminis]
MKGSFSGRSPRCAPRRALCNRRDVHPPWPGRGQLRVRCHDADAGQLGPEHHREVLARLARPSLRRRRAQQWQTQTGDVADARNWGSPKMEGTQEVPPFDYVAYAASLGLIGLRVEKPEQVGPAWDQAFAADRPVLVDCVCGPTIPTIPIIPPKRTLDQQINYLATLMKGDPNEKAIIKNSFKRYVTS